MCLAVGEFRPMPKYYIHLYITVWNASTWSLLENSCMVVTYAIYQYVMHYHSDAAPT